MDLTPTQPEENRAGQSIIIHFQLDLQQSGNRHTYIWQQHPPDADRGKKAAILVDLNNINMPDTEIEKMVSTFLVPATAISAIAFANCHPHNQQVIKRKLKAGDVKLYSNTAFFMDILRAWQWLLVQHT